MAEKVTAGRDTFGDFAPKYAELNDDVLFGQVWSREEQLSARDRSVVIVTAIMASGVLTPALQGHIERAKANGVTAEETVELPAGPLRTGGLLRRRRPSHPRR